MRQEANMETENGVVVPASALLQRQRNRYGSIPDLPDEELASPEELERLVFQQEWGPVLHLPVRGGNPIKPNIDEYFGVDLGAFATVDFERTMPPFDNARYREDKLREQRRDVRITIDTIRYRIRDKNKYVVLRYALRSVINVADILDGQLHAGPGRNG